MAKTQTPVPVQQEAEPAEQICGLIMPISAIDDCSEQHWKEVKEIIDDCILKAGFIPNLVSDAREVGVIQKGILQNLAENPMVVCDISCRNANVMLELGIRLTFDKPTIIIKDDKTVNPFDTTPIEYLQYPRSLRFKDIEEFKARLTEKIRNTHDVASKDENYSTFLKHFGDFKVAKIETVAATQQDVVLEQIQNDIKVLTSLILNNQQRKPSVISQPLKADWDIEICLGDVDADSKRVKSLTSSLLRLFPNSGSIVATLPNNGHKHVVLHANRLTNAEANAAAMEVQKLLDAALLNGPAFDGCSKILVIPPEANALFYK